MYAICDPVSISGLPARPPLLMTEAKVRSITVKGCVSSALPGTQTYEYNGYTDAYHYHVRSITRDRNGGCIQSELYRGERTQDPTRPFGLIARFSTGWIQIPPISSRGQPPPSSQGRELINRSYIES